MKGVLFLVGYLFVFFAVLVGMVWWDRRQRKTKPPLPENLRLLRMPGEYLWLRVIRNDEADFQWLGAAALIPILVGAGVLQFVSWCFRSSPFTGLFVSLIIFLASLLLCVRWCQRRLQRRADDYLGFFGERYVAEWLEPLKAGGWFIFHDIQCAGATGKFNLDHVAVGPGGVWVVETKTRRKGRSRPGLKAHEVLFDGQRIIWPSVDDTESLEQAFDNARWLQDWLAKVTGKSIEVAAVVAVPGYCVIEKRLGAVRLANPKVLPQVLVSRGKNVLTEDDIDVIRRQLEEKCRDVEY